MLSDPDGYRDETSVFQSERFFVPIHRDQNDNRTILFGHSLRVEKMRWSGEGKRNKKNDQKLLIEL